MRVLTKAELRARLTEVEAENAELRRVIVSDGMLRVGLEGDRASALEALAVAEEKAEKAARLRQAWDAWISDNPPVKAWQAVWAAVEAVIGET